MNAIEKIYLDRALFYKELYKKAKWWQFRKKRIFKKRWHHAREQMMKYA